LAVIRTKRQVLSLICFQRWGGRKKKDITPCERLLIKQSRRLTSGLLWAQEKRNAWIGVLAMVQRTRRDGKGRGVSLN